MEDLKTTLKNHIIGEPDDKRVEILKEIETLSTPELEYLLSLINRLNECGLKHKFDYIKSSTEGLSYSAKHSVYLIKQ